MDVIARRSPPVAQDASVPTKEFIEKDATRYAPHISSLSPAPSIMFSSLATTRAAAGGFDKQYKIDHDLNVELARAAKQAGTKTFVLISSQGASPTSFFAYPKMKGETEEHIRELDFEHMVIVRPGLIACERPGRRVFEAVLCKVAAAMGKISTHWLKDGWAQDPDVIARAAVAAAMKAQNGEMKEKVWTMSQSDIIRLGRTEWKERTQ